MNAFQQFDVFTETELAMIKNVAKKIPRQKHNWDDVYSNGFTRNDPIFPIFEKLVFDKINATCPVKIKNITVAMTLVTRNPFGIHSDFSNKGDSGHGYAFIVPLDQTPMPGKSIIEPSCTIVFDQSSMTSLIDKFFTAEIPVGKPTAEHIWEKHCTHTKKEHLEKLSISIIAPWIYGSVIGWDRTLLHTSDDCPKKNILEKTGLVIFTSND
jgi:hypothetical protein